MLHDDGCYLTSPRHVRFTSLSVAGVNSTPVWKLKRVLNKLPVTNNLGNRLAEEPPPLGFKWGKTL